MWARVWASRSTEGCRFAPLRGCRYAWAVGMGRETDDVADVLEIGHAATEEEAQVEARAAAVSWRTRRKWAFRRAATWKAEGGAE